MRELFIKQPRDFARKRKVEGDLAFDVEEETRVFVAATADFAAGSYRKSVAGQEKEDGGLTVADGSTGVDGGELEVHSGLSSGSYMIH